jgi:hypothetical protein
MKGRFKLAAGVAALAAVSVAGTVAVAGGGDSIREELTGYEEDPLVLSTTGNGSFRARISESREEISYRLRYADLEGNITQAHIDLGGATQSTSKYTGGEIRAQLEGDDKRRPERPFGRRAAPVILPRHRGAQVPLR